MRTRIRWISLLVLLGFATGCPTINWHFLTVEPGVFYRSAQMSGGLLSVVIKKYGIGTVINFRGANPGTNWYDREVAVCKERGAAHYDFSWSMDALPSPESLLEYVTLLETTPKAILVHCEGGTHRAGVASACYLLTQGASVDEARGQFRLFFNNAHIGHLLDLYEPSSLPFAEWVATEYPALYAAENPPDDAAAK